MRWEAAGFATCIIRVARSGHWVIGTFPLHKTMVFALEGVIMVT